MTTKERTCRVCGFARSPRLGETLPGRNWKHEECTDAARRARGELPPPASAPRSSGPPRLRLVPPPEPFDPKGLNEPRWWDDEAGRFKADEPRWVLTECGKVVWTCERVGSPAPRHDCPSEDDELCQVYELVDPDTAPTHRYDRFTDSEIDRVAATMPPTPYEAAFPEVRPRWPVKAQEV